VALFSVSSVLSLGASPLPALVIRRFAPSLAVIPPSPPLLLCLAVADVRNGHAQLIAAWLSTSYLRHFFFDFSGSLFKSPPGTVENSEILSLSERQ